MNPNKPAAWLVPTLTDFTGARKVSFFRAEGNTSTDEELKNVLQGTVIWTAETVFLDDGDESVTDRYGIKHFPKPLFTRDEISDDDIIALFSKTMKAHPNYVEDLDGDPLVDMDEEDSIILLGFARALLGGK